jgi:hypothetical protein
MLHPVPSQIPSFTYLQVWFFRKGDRVAVILLFKFLSGGLKAAAQASQTPILHHTDCCLTD